MKRFFIFILVLAAVVSITASCSNGSDKSHKPESIGGLYELFVIMPKEQWKGMVGDTIRAVFLEPVQMINQREPIMDVRQIERSAFNNISEKHRNILIINTDTTLKQAISTVDYDVYAAPQVVITISGANGSAISDYMWNHRAELVQVYNMAERDRIVTNATAQTSKNINEEISKKFGFNMNVPFGYTIRDNKADFMWISYELPLASQGIVIYSYPYSGKSDFELDSLVSKRNKFSALIPGPSDNSHMTTADIDPDLRHIRINGRFWSEMRGLWDVKGDFMGGPFISYSTLDTATSRVICIDCYVFSPKKPKRNYIRLLENLIYTVSFPGEPKVE